ncbi:hypothetical protein U27_05404 [Candidatus Vecturithrix granuli]|uniref:Uncharacterized protein n=1 Tax=Vecturithrix granuli TaxID=1499967 RepID=A0A081C1H5_VECG1|nr:hypothetical protein U27_05404 [Candidatus Vecturithrix granuli]
MAFEKEGDLDRVITAYQKQIEITPDTADAGYAWIDMGIAFWKQGQLQQATDTWKQAENIHAAILEEEPDDLTMLANDDELALVQGNLSRLQTRIEAVRPHISPDDQLFVLLPFFA